MRADLQQRKARVALLSVASNTTLVLAKLAVGLFIGSVSVISEAIHSGVDLLAALIAFYAVKTSSKPADEEHPFGHGKIENVSGAVEALLIFLAGGWIIVEALHKLRQPAALDAAGWGVLVMLISAVLNFIVSRQLFRVGRQTDSVALLADAWHLRTDVWTSAGVMTGLALIAIGRWCLPGVNLQWLDPVSAIIVATMILHAAFRLTVEAGRDLLDVNLPAEEHAWLHDYLKGLGPEVARGYHRLRTRKSGATRFVEFHLFVEPDLSVESSHVITGVIKVTIRDRLPGSDITIHVEPYDATRAPKARHEASAVGRQ